MKNNFLKEDITRPLEIEKDDELFFKKLPKKGVVGSSSQQKINEREKKLLKSLYDFYVGSSTKELKEGDTIKYNYPGSKHHGKIGIFVGYGDDGKIRVKFGNVVLSTREKYLEKLKDQPQNIERLIKILEQMVADGDLSRAAVDKFLKELKGKEKLKEIDPYEEENWEDEDKDAIITRKPSPQPRQGYYDPCGGGSSSRGC
jgi:hypothetical protein